MKTELKLVRRHRVRPAFRFSDPQQRVISHRGSPLVVYGGPGTGKTTTLIEAVISRIREGADPDSILILTYGRQWASELRDQIALAAGSTSFEPLARTFHALAFSILNQKLRDGDLRYVLISGAEQDAAIKEMLTNPLVQIPWHPELAQALTTRGFVREVRDLILRATELGLTPRDLQAMGERLGEKYWDGAAKFWASYHGAQELASATVGERLVKIDPSSIIFEAIELLRTDPVRLEYFRKRFSTIVVDEFQESDPSHRELLKLLAGEDLLIFADPDSAVGRFRGADPDGLLQACAAITSRAGESQSITLERDFRSVPEINHLGVAVAAGFRSQSPTRKRSSELSTPSHGAHPPIEFAKLTGLSESADFIAYQLRRAHLHDNIPWSEMAIILRSPGADVAAIQRACARHSIPLQVDSTALALAENPAVIPLLALAELAIKRNELRESDWPLIEELLLSEFGGAGALELRRIRLALSKVRTDNRSTTRMMIDALTAEVSEIPWEEMAPIKRINNLLTLGSAQIRKGANISELLWTLWENATDYEGRKISDLWRDRALEGGYKGAQADRDLDAVISLFESARRFNERNQGAKPQLFIDQIRNERILADSITATAQREEVVSLLTVHSTKGRQWSYVVVTGLQEGSWPNLKERGSLLGSERLVEFVRTGLSSKVELAAATAAGLAEDERRLLHVALTRAQKRLLIAAYSTEDSIPSRFFEELYEISHHESSESLVTQIHRPLTTQALVAELRRKVEAGSEFAASLLATLAAAGMRSADPSHWLGIRPLSSDQSVVPADQKIYISPSSLDSFDECGLKWFLERSGARDADSTAQLLGVAIHFIAAQVHANPDLSLNEGIEQLVNAWPAVDQSVGWYKESQLTTAKRMLTRFFEWHFNNPRRLVFAEEPFTVEFGRVILRGNVDRLEIDPGSGKYFIVDLKTGTTVTKEKAAKQKQLKAYQLGVTEGGFEKLPDDAQSAGAGLLYLSKETKVNETLDQPPVNSGEFIEEVTIAAEAMSAATFTATINSRCQSCQVKALCPLQSQGRSVLE
jgi:superfamily I DNA/RNA helicase/RecB family exonuclease